MGLIGLIVGYGLASGMGTVAIPTVPAAPSAPSGPVAPSVPAGPTAPAATVDDDPSVGSDDATITLIEFTDYQCPFCSRHFTQTYGQIKRDYVDTGKVKYVLRDFPLSFHPFAQKAAEASECADEQGKFWEMHDMLFAKQGEWSQSADAVPTFKQFAATLGLNKQKFDSCLDSGDMKAEVLKDLADGSAAGIDGTPGFWILGPGGKTKQISGAYPYETFKAEFDGMLQ